MDIPAFVGFATAGPVGTPVPVEDVARFREIFREDVRLAWDSERKEPQYSYLGQTVESFFRNGGLRCWVVRVAGQNVQHALFTLPHVIPTASAAPLFNPDGQFKEAGIRARSAGIWAEELRVSTLLSRDGLRLPPIDMPEAFGSNQVPVYLEEDTGTDTFHINVISTPAGLQSQDLLRITFSAHGPILFLFINEIQQNNRSLTVSGKAAFWFVCESTISPPVSPMVAEDDACRNLVPIDKAEGNSWLESWRSVSPPPAEPITKNEFRKFWFRHRRIFDIVGLKVCRSL